MRNLKKNKQRLKYANFVRQKPIYAHEEKYFLTDNDRYLMTEESGHLIVDPVMDTDIDGVSDLVIEAYKDVYSEPVVFKANISFDSGQTQLGEFGLNPSDYNAIISYEKGKLPFDERTLIWFESEPEYDEQGDVKPESADYRVIAIKTSLNEERFLLKKRVDD